MKRDYILYILLVFFIGLAYYFFYQNSRSQADIDLKDNTIGLLHDRNDSLNREIIENTQTIDSLYSKIKKLNITLNVYQNAIKEYEGIYDEIITKYDNLLRLKDLTQDSLLHLEKLYLELSGTYLDSLSIYKSKLNDLTDENLRFQNMIDSINTLNKDLQEQDTTLKTNEVVVASKSNEGHQSIVESLRFHFKSIELINKKGEIINGHMSGNKLDSWKETRVQIFIKSDIYDESKLEIEMGVFNLDQQHFLAYNADNPLYAGSSDNRFLRLRYQKNVANWLKFVNYENKSGSNFELRFYLIIDNKRYRLDKMSYKVIVNNRIIEAIN